MKQLFNAPIQTYQTSNLTIGFYRTSTSHTIYFVFTIFVFPIAVSLLLIILEGVWRLPQCQYEPRFHLFFVLLRYLTFLIKQLLFVISNQQHYELIASKLRLKRNDVNAVDVTCELCDNVYRRNGKSIRTTSVKEISFVETILGTYHATRTQHFRLKLGQSGKSRINK